MSVTRRIIAIEHRGAQSFDVLACSHAMPSGTARLRRQCSVCTARKQARNRRRSIAVNEHHQRMTGRPGALTSSGSSTLLRAENAQRTLHPPEPEDNAGTDDPARAMHGTRLMRQLDAAIDAALDARQQAML